MIHISKYFTDNISDKNRAREYLDNVYGLCSMIRIVKFYNYYIRNNERLYNEYGEQPLLAVANFLKDRPIKVTYSNNCGEQDVIWLKDGNDLESFVQFSKNKNINIVEIFNYIKKACIDLDEFSS